jgi:tetratricopeptide (TPR) repeat protein
MALTISRYVQVRGRPRALRPQGNKGARRVHCSSFKSVGYARRGWVSIPQSYLLYFQNTLLGKDEAEEFLTVLLGNDLSLRRLRHLVLEKTEGTPFFMEEIVQDLVEQGVLARDSGGGAGLRPASSVLSFTNFHLPTTVQGVLAARIDRLGAEEKALLQQLAVIGREFPWSLLRHVISRPEDDLYRLLASLQHKEFLYEHPAFPEVEYTFKHALTQEVAYSSVLIERRRVLHERTAQAIEALFASQLEDHYGELAHHYSRSGNTPKAVEYLHLAGQQAVRRSAPAEAISHLTAALELLNTLPDTPERAQHELTLQVALRVPLVMTKGYTAEVEQVCTRALELCRQVGETPQLFPAQVGLHSLYLMRAELQTARALGEQLLRLAQRVQDPAFLLSAHYGMGLTLFSLGEFPSARGHFEQGIAVYGSQPCRSPAFSTGNLGAGCLSMVAVVLWLLGHPDHAQKRIQEASPSPKHCLPPTA